MKWFKEANEETPLNRLINRVVFVLEFINRDVSTINFDKVVEFLVKEKYLDKKYSYEELTEDKDIKKIYMKGLSKLRKDLKDGKFGDEDSIRKEFQKYYKITI